MKEYRNIFLLLFVAVLGLSVTLCTRYLTGAQNAPAEPINLTGSTVSSGAQAQETASDTDRDEAPQPVPGPVGETKEGTAYAAAPDAGEAKEAALSPLETAPEEADVGERAEGAARSDAVNPYLVRLEDLRSG